VASETSAQVVAWKTGIKGIGSSPEILHVDGHHHAHVHPVVVQTIAKILHEHGVQSVRIPCDAVVQQSPPPVKGPSQSGPSGYPEELVKAHGEFVGMPFFKSVSKWAADARTVFEELGLKYSDSFIGMTLMGSNTTDMKSWEDAITAAVQSARVKQESLRNPIILEIMAHPGNRLDIKKVDPSLLKSPSASFWFCPFSQSPDRELERDTLCSSSLQKIIMDTFQGSLTSSFVSSLNSHKCFPCSREPEREPASVEKSKESVAGPSTQMLGSRSGNRTVLKKRASRNKGKVDNT